MTIDTNHPLFRAGRGELVTPGKLPAPKPVVDLEYPGAEIYDAAYYGSDPDHAPRANYRGYNDASVPHWARPLAQWLATNCQGPFLDVGCAFGHLVRALRDFGRESWGVEWSAYAQQHRVTDYALRGDARRLPWNMATFGTIYSADLLEHFEPADTIRVMSQMYWVSKPGATMLHVIGAHNPAEDISRHLSDPTHQNHWSLETYLVEFEKLGFRLDEALTESARQIPQISGTDWPARMVVLRDERKL